MPRRRKYAAPTPALPIEEIGVSADPPAEEEDPEKKARLEQFELCFIERPAVLEWFKTVCPDMEYQDRAPVWAVVAVDAYFCTANFGIAEWRSALDVIELVRQD